jgi:hypothetical protein
MFGVIRPKMARPVVRPKTVSPVPMQPLSNMLKFILSGKGKSCRRCGGK